MGDARTHRPHPVAELAFSLSVVVEFPILGVGPVGIEDDANFLPRRGESCANPVSVDQTRDRRQPCNSRRTGLSRRAVILPDYAARMTDNLADSVLRAAADLVAAFGSHDTRRYFDGFAPEATFLFHAEPAILPNRSAYEALWAEWERDGFRVLSCQSLEPRVDLVTHDVAVFTHTVRTRLAGVADEQRERETIVFRREAGSRWLGVHEHLSPDEPAA